MNARVILIIFLSGCATTSDSATPPKIDLAVATYNVNFGIAGDPPTLQAIRDTRADVVMLQETTPAWEQSIRNALSDLYPHIIFAHSERWPAGGLGFLSRYPLHQAKQSPSAIGFFPAWRVIADTPSGKVQLVNLHLKPPVSTSGSYVSGVFVTPPERAREVSGHLSLIKPGLPTVVAGDFNEESGGGLAVLTKRHDLVDALAGRSTYTWRWKLSVLTLRGQLDHIVYDPERLRCVDVRVLRRGRSDHLPVVALFLFRS